MIIVVQREEHLLCVNLLKELQYTYRQIHKFKVL